ncbi:hypothetical protein GWI33_022873 [Rhynchophorus ferrugineus]|uniref:Cytochrome P450 n=1 Tax=Rhynchophorus ferrugineus TaxID=354439 RepID=A0A834IQ38_RHYFE|nr:hypothetical protein GWI33_022873 [Rhynchophorus ferrugineus]
MKHNGPRYFPYFGNIVFSGNNVLATYLKVRRDYGMPYAIWIHDDLCYATDDPKEIKVILNHPDCFNKATFYSKVVESCLFDGFALIPISEIDKWKLYRRFAAKSMRPAILLAVLGRRTTFQRVIPDYFWKYHTENGKDFCNIINTIRKQVYEIIQMKRQAFQKETNNDTLNSTKFLNSYLQDEGTVFTDEEIFHQVYFLAAASTETSALSVCFILLQLGMDQDVQEKVHQEIIDLLGTDKEIVLQDLNKLKYTEQVIFETLRIYPVLPFLGRQATSNIRLDGKIIPNGTNIIVSPYMIHRNEKYWPDCEKFNPERFNAEESKNIEPGSFVPFLLGPRDCVGRHYGMTMMKVFLTNIIREFRIVARKQSIDDMKLSYYITMKPTSNVDLQFIQRAPNH